MKLLMTLFSLVFFSCNPMDHEAFCVTSLGLKYMGEWPTGNYIFRNDYSCEYFESAQNKLIASFNAPINLKGLDIKRLKDVEIWVRPADWWVDEFQREVAGVSYCYAGFFQINSAPFAIQSSFAHEMVHILQGCNSPLPIDKHSDKDHSNWYRDGFYEAIEKSKQ
jgi:hypothetical protein